MTMKTLMITRRELVTYSKIIDLSDELAEKLLNDPDSHEVELDRICRPTDENWLDSDDAEFEVEEYQE